MRSKKVSPEDDDVKWELADSIYLHTFDGKKTPLSSLLQDGRKTVFVFMRRFDCPTCYTYVMLFSHLREVLSRSNIRVIFVTCSLDVGEVEVFIRSFAFWLRTVSVDGLSPLPGELYLDYTREAYKFFGIGNTLGKLDYIQLWWSLTIERKFGLFKTTNEVNPGKVNRNRVSEHHAFLDLMNYVRLRMPLFIKHMGFHKDSVFWQSPGIIVTEGKKLLYRYVLSEQAKWIPTTPKNFVSDAFGIDENDVNYDPKDSMLNFVEAITDKARTARINDGELKLKARIGQGTESEVYESEWFGMKVAVKYFRFNVGDSDIDLDNERDVIESFSNEAAIMMGLRHPNIMNLMGFGIKPPQHFIIMKYMPRGSLFHVIGNKEIALDADRKKQMILGVASAMDYMHSRTPPVLHADMKSLNLLVDQDWTLCISDFGFSKELRQSYDEDRGSGTLQWLSPEGLVDKAKSTKETDVYGFGVVLWEIATRRRPWKDTKRSEIIERVKKGERPPILDSDKWSKAFRELVEDCWHQDPKKRPSFRAIHKRLLKIQFPA